jgi:hypothetical protein
VHLGRGNVIVEAAKRRTGHLYVASADCTVSVTGTVFSVSRGVKGSRVSVLEGEVRVRRASGETVLHPGQQLATSTSLGAIPLKQEIAWSRKLDQHLALVGELSALHKDMEDLRTPGLRYETHLLRVVPPAAVAFIAAPNYGESLAQAHALFEERVQQSEVLRQWWQKAGAGGRGPSVADVVARLRDLGAYLGQEVAVAFVPAPGERLHHLLLADAGRSGLRDFMETGFFVGPKHPVVHFVEGAMPAAPPAAASLYVLIRPDVVAASDDWATLRSAAACLDGQGPGLDQTPFGQRITEAYRDGTSLLVAADARQMGQRELRVGDLRYFIAERAEVSGRSRNTADLLFFGRRQGVSSWLGAPAPMGSLDFISPEATGVLSVVTKSPALVFEDLLSPVGGPRALRRLSEIEERVGIRVRDDLAAALGSDFTVALDGPLLPTPAFKLVGEVYDPERLERTFEVLVEAYNREAAVRGRRALRLDHEQAGDRVVHVLRTSGEGLGTDLHYAFSGGYLVVAPSRPLVLAALAVRESGRSLNRSARLLELLPPDGQTHVSALLYQNLATAGALAEGLERLSPDQKAMVSALAAQSKPTLVYAYGQEDRIQMAGDLFNLDPGSLALPALVSRATIVPGR